MSHGVRMWRDRDRWRWTAWHEGHELQGVCDNPLEARRQGLEWLNSRMGLVPQLDEMEKVLGELRGAPGRT